MSFVTNRFNYGTRSSNGSRSVVAPSKQVARPTTHQSTDHLQNYKEMVEAIARSLMKQGLTFIEAYEEVLAIGRLDPQITVQQVGQGNPSSDRVALLEFKAYNAVCRLRNKYSDLLNNAR